MSKQKNTDEITQHKDKSIQILNDYLTDLISRDKKKADSLSYWIHSYTNALKFEEVFEPSRNKKYERGDIIEVDFGFRIGSEHGGLHYAMVLDNNNEKNSPVVTVIPLSSSDGSDVHKTEVYLGDDIYQKLKNKIAGMLTAYKTEMKETEFLRNMVNETIESISTNKETMSDDEYNHEIKIALTTLNNLQAKEKSIKEKSEALEKARVKIAKMKRGSIALISQITTISKIRIKDPKNTHGVLNGIRLSPNNLNLINDKIKKLFLYQ